MASPPDPGDLLKPFRILEHWIALGVPAKLNADSEGKPNGIPG
jgi:hypothetical protein